MGVWILITVLLSLFWSSLFGVIGWFVGGYGGALVGAISGGFLVAGVLLMVASWCYAVAQDLNVSHE